MSVIGEAFVLIRPETAGFAGSLERKMETQAGLFGNIGKIAGAAAVVGAGAALFGIGEEFEKAFNKVRVQTGATGAAFNTLKVDTKAVLAGTAGSFDQVSAAVGGLYQRTHLLGPALEDFAKKQVTLGRITKTDVAANVETTTSLFNRYQIATKDQSRELDVLFKASQQGGKGLQTLVGELQKGAPALQAFGFGFEKSTALVAGLEQAGVNVTPVLTGLRTAFGKIAKEGGDPQQVLAKTFQELRDGKNPTLAMADAIKLFGARGGAELSAAIKSGRFDVDGLLKTITDGKGGILETGAEVSTLGGKFARLRNIVLVALEPIASGLVEIANKGLGYLVNAVVAAGPAISAGWHAITDGIRSAWDSVVTGFQNPASRIAASVGGVRGFFVQVGQAAHQAVDVIVSTWQTVAPIVGSVFDRIRSAVAPVLSAIGSSLGKLASNNVKPILVGIATALGLVTGGAILSGLSILASLIGGALVAAVGALVAVLTSPVVLIGVLAAALTYAYLHFASFRLIVNQVATIVRRDLIVAFREVSAWITNTAVPALKRFAETMRPVIDSVVAFVKQHPEVVFGALAAAVLLLVSPVAAVAAGFVLLFERNKPFHDFVVNKLLPALRAFASFMVEDVLPAVETVVRSLISGFTSLAEGVASRWADIQKSVENVLAVLKVVVGIALAPILLAWKLFHDQILEVLIVAWQLVQNVVKGALQILIGIVDVLLGILSGHWGRAWDGIKEIVNGVWQIVHGVVEAAFGVLRAIFFAGLHALEAIWSGVWHGLASILSSAWSALLGVLGALITVFVFQFVKIPLAVVTALGSLGIALVAWAASGFLALVGAVPGLLAPVLSWFASIGSLVGGALGTAGSWLVDVGRRALAGLWQGVQAGWSAGLSFLGGLGALVVAALGDASSWLLDVGRSVVAGLWSGVQAEWDAGVTFFTNLGATVLGLLVGAGSWLLDVGRQIIGGLWQGIGAAWDAEVNFWTNLSGVVLGLLGNVGSWLVGAGQQIIGGLWRGIREGWNAEIAFLTGLANAALTALGDVGSWLLDAGGQVLGGLGAGFRVGWAREMAFWTNLPGAILSALAGAGTWLLATGADVLRGMRDGLVNGLTTVISWFRNLPQEITSAVGDVGTWLLHAGEDLISGFIQGIEDKAQGIGSWIADKLNPVNDVKSLLGIFSPSQKMRELGRSVPEGFAQGVSEGAARSSDVAAEAINKMFEQLDPNRGGNLAGSAFANAFTTAVNSLIASGLDPEGAVAVFRTLDIHQVLDPTAFVTLSQAQLSVQQGFVNLRDTLATTPGAVDKVTGSLNLNTQGGVSAAQSMQSLVSQSLRLAEQQVTTGTSVDVATGRLAAHATQLADTAVQAGVSRDKASQLVATLLGVPKDVASHVHNNAQLAQAVADTYRDHLTLIPHDLHTKVTFDASQAFATLNALNFLAGRTEAQAAALNKLGGPVHFTADVPGGSPYPDFISAGKAIVRVTGKGIQSAGPSVVPVTFGMPDVTGGAQVGRSLMDRIGAGVDDGAGRVVDRVHALGRRIGAVRLPAPAIADVAATAVVPGATRQIPIEFLAALAERNAAALAHAAHPAPVAAPPAPAAPIERVKTIQYSPTYHKEIDPIHALQELGWYVEGA